VARPSLLTPETHRTIVAALQAGTYLDTAASVAGINRDTLREWLKRGAREARRREAGKKAARAEDRYVAFSAAVKKALAMFELAAISGIRNAGQNQWQALAWLLERRMPHRYGRQDRPPVEDDLELREDEAALDHHDLRELLADGNVRSAVDAVAKRLEGDAGRDGGPPQRR